MNRKRQRVVVITGASAGVGRATARRFAAPGVRIGLMARGRVGLEATVRELEAAGAEALAIPTDVSDPQQVEAAAEAIERSYGPMDVWINNAMVSVFSPVDELRPEEIRRVTEVTYLGTVYGTMSALKRMLPRNRGTIIQVGSALAYRGIPLQAAYCGAKHAIQGFTESLRCELMHERSRVRVTMIQMPALNTPQFEWVRNRLPSRPQPVPPIYEPELAAEAIYYSAKHPRREMYVGLPTVEAILGNRVIPGMLDRYLARNGYRSQQTSEPEISGRPDNLWAPVDQDKGARGRFNQQAQAGSVQFWLDRNIRWLAVAGMLAAGMTALLRKTRQAG